MNHWLRLTSSLLLFYMVLVPSLMLCCPGLWLSRIKRHFAVHRQVDERHLAAIELVYRGRRVVTIGNAARSALLGAFNDVCFMAKRRYKIGAATHLRLRLCNGETITVMVGKNRNDLCVVRIAPNGKTTSYWGIHPYLYTYLAHQLWLSHPKQTVTNKNLKRIK